MPELNAKTRKTIGKKVKSLRKKGIIPAVFYGAKTKSESIKVNYGEFEKIYNQIGESTILKLNIKDSKTKKEKTKNVLIHEVAKDPVTDKFSHIDFYAVRMDKPITADVSLVFEGESPAVKNLEGTLVKNINELKVEALPADLPSEIKVDISSLETFDDLIKIKDLDVSKDVKILADKQEAVASVSPPRTEEELAALEEEVEEKPEEVEKVGEEEEEAAEMEETGEEKEPKKEEKPSEASGEKDQSSADQSKAEKK